MRLLSRYVVYRFRVCVGKVVEDKKSESVDKSSSLVDVEMVK
jgi:hypothetical protein